MKKLLGVLICAGILCAGGLTAFFVNLPFPAGVTASNNFSTGIGVTYYDDNLLTDRTNAKNLNAFAGANFVTFTEYDGYGATVGTTGTFTINYTNHLVEPSQDSRSGEWVDVTWGATKAQLDANLVTYDPENAIETTTANRVSEAPYFSFEFEKTGVYCIEIYTINLEEVDFPSHTTTIYFIAQKTVDIVSKFPQTLNEDTQTVNCYNNMDVDTELYLTFDGAGDIENPRIKDSLDNITVDNTALFNFFEVGFDFDTEGYETMGRIVLTKKDETKVTNGTYIITFRVLYNPFDNVGTTGALVPGNAATSYIDVKATITFVDAPAGYEFPWTVILICAGILAAFAIILYAVNYALRRIQMHNVAKQHRAAEQRAEVERENLERMREQMTPPPDDKTPRR